MKLIILPQAFRTIIAAVAYTQNVLFQDTSLVYVLSGGLLPHHASTIGERDGTQVSDSVRRRVYFLLSA